MWNFDVTENGVIRVRSRRFLAHLNGTGEKPNFGLFFSSFFSFLGFFQHFSHFFPNFFPKKLPLIGYPNTSNIIILLPVKHCRERRPRPAPPGRAAARVWCRLARWRCRKWIAAMRCREEYCRAKTGIIIVILRY